MFYLLLLYIPLALGVTAVLFFGVQRFSRRGLGRLPRVPSAFHREVAELLHATPVIDDAGLGWRMTLPAEVRISLPFVLPGGELHAGGLNSPVLSQEKREGAWDESNRLPEMNLDHYRARHFAFVLRWPLPQIRPSPAMPVVFGLPAELVSQLFSTEDGRHPPDQPWEPVPPSSFRLQSSSIERILRDWPEFDGDLDRLTKSVLKTDFARAFVLLRDELVWLEKPLWPADQAPPAPFVINVMGDEAWLLCVCPGRSIADALSGPDWVALQMAWFAGALPKIAAGVLAAQGEVRDIVVQRRAERKAAAETMLTEQSQQALLDRARREALAAFRAEQDAAADQASGDVPADSPGEPPMLPPAAP